MKRISIILFVFLIAGCSSNRLERIIKRLDIDLSNCKIVYDKDTHGGFLGDGDYFAKIVCNEESIDLSNWKSLPLSSEIQKVMDLKQCMDNGCEDVYERYNIPKIDNGYYLFRDRHSDSVDILDDKDLNNRSSYNFSLGIYDNEYKILYYYELDT